MRGWKGICGKCAGPPTCECFVSSTDLQEGAGPSSAAGRPTPSPQHHVVQWAPLEILGMLVEGSAHRSALEVVVEESIDLHQEDSIYIEEDFTIPELPITSPTIRSTPSRAAPPASASPRKALWKTRGVPGGLREGLQEEQLGNWNMLRPILDY